MICLTEYSKNNWMSVKSKMEVSAIVNSRNLVELEFDFLLMSYCKIIRSIILYYYNAALQFDNYVLLLY